MTKSEMRPCPRCGHVGYRVRFVEQQFVIIKCVRCGLVFLGNPPDSDRLYDDYYGSDYHPASQYSTGSSVAELAEIFSINTQRIEAIRKFRPQGKLLDIGCGRGLFLKTAMDGGYTVKGFDISATAVDYARREFGIDAEVRSIEDLAGYPGSFDLVTMWHVLEHFSDPIRTLKAVHSLLAPSAHCFIEVPNLRSAKFIMSGHKWQGGNHPLYHRTFFNSRSLSDLLKESGFRNIRRLRLSYRLPGRSFFYEASKQILNLAAMDAFLDFVAER